MRVVAGSLVQLGVVLGMMVHAAFLGLSAFVRAGLNLAGLTDWCGMGLLLAQMPWNRAPRSGAAKTTPRPAARANTTPCPRATNPLCRAPHGSPVLIFTGNLLFVGEVGRSDLRDSDSDPRQLADYTSEHFAHGVARYVYKLASAGEWLDRLRLG